MSLDLLASAPVLGLITQPVSVAHYLVVGAIMFVCGIVCMAMKRNALGVLMGIELVLNGTNVNFVQVKGPNFIRVRTYERGVEGETLACGTGVTASALVSARIHGFTSPVRVQVQGGDELAISFTDANGQFDQVDLNGPATFVFEGRIQV